MTTRIPTALTEMFGIEHPILLAPMAGLANGRLAAAVSAAGGLGVLGGGYGDAAWVERECRAAGNARVGIGFITWSLDRNPAVLDTALAHRPAAIFLSFGDPAPYAERVRAAGARLICQVQTAAAARAAAAGGADLIVAQGTEAGGHGGRRGTFTLVPEVADAVAPIPVVAAGGIADGRGLAAALMLGACGVLVGSRFYVSRESAAHANAKAKAVAATGDDTHLGHAVDIVRDLPWPRDYPIRTLKDSFTARWEGREAELVAARGTIRPEYEAAIAAGDMSLAPTLVGEAAGLIRAEPGAGEIVERMVADAARLLGR